MKSVNQSHLVIMTGGLTVALFTGCAAQKDLSQITPEPFGKTLDGRRPWCSSPAKSITTPASPNS